jgi:hypothetical protein
MGFKKVLRENLSNYWLKSIPVSLQTRQAFEAALPGLLPADIAAWRLLAWRYFTGFVDGDTGRVVLPAPVLALCEGKKYHPNNYSATPFLERFNRRISPLALTGYSPRLFSRGTARQITSLGCDAALSDVVREAQQRAVNGKAEMVDFVTGEPWNKPRRKAETAGERAYVEQFSGLANSPAGNHIAAYMAGLERYRETYDGQIARHWDAALLCVAKLYASCEADTEAERSTKLAGWESQSRALTSLKGQPVPFVRPSKKERTSRLTPVGSSWVTLKREARKELTRGWDQLDLQAAQLAIVARLWRIPELVTFLAEGGNIWQRLIADLGLAADAKPALKTAVYKLCFGACEQSGNVQSPKAITNGLDLALGPGVGRAFIRHPLMWGVLRARARVKKQVLAEGGARDCFGNWIALETDTRPGYEKRKVPFAGVTWRSVLAQCAQAVEVALIDEAFKVADTTDHFFIAVYLYDGIVVAWRKPRDRARWIAAMQAAVQQKADEMGIATRLLFEE